MNNKKTEILGDKLNFHMRIYDHQIEKAHKYEEQRDRFLGFIFTLITALITVFFAVSMNELRLVIAILVFVLGITGYYIVDKFYERYKFRVQRARYILEMIDKGFGNDLVNILELSDKQHTTKMEEIYYKKPIGLLRYLFGGRAPLEYKYREKKNIDRKSMKYQVEKYKQTRGNYAGIWLNLCGLIMLTSLILCGYTIYSLF